MKTFKNFFEETKKVLGVREIVTFPEHPELGNVEAKVDTGNEAHNVLHGIDIKDSGDQVTFNTVNGKTLTLQKVDTIKIHIGSGIKEDRPVVKLNFNLNGQSYKDVPFSIADRSENEEPILLGEPFLKNTNSIVDSNKS
ncbi:MAG: hypothetical protein EBU90_11605 [Proteobacteria bacterium]|nr:hypothetical protein [Pseudomonadota bacterium]NBP14771.1 hypothetical protein [bacterium]